MRGDEIPQQDKASLRNGPGFLPEPAAGRSSSLSYSKGETEDQVGKGLAQLSRRKTASRGHMGRGHIPAGAFADQSPSTVDSQMISTGSSVMSAGTMTLRQAIFFLPAVLLVFLPPPWLCPQSLWQVLPPGLAIKCQCLLSSELLP